MTGTIEISTFMDHLEKKGLVIVPRNLVENRLQEVEFLKLQKQLKRKPALTYKEIVDGKLWGDIGKHAVKNYASKYAKPGEIFKVKKSKQEIQKVITVAVKRIAKQRGEVWD